MAKVTGKVITVEAGAGAGVEVLEGVMPQTVTKAGVRAEVGAETAVRTGDLDPEVEVGQYLMQALDTSLVVLHDHVLLPDRQIEVFRRMEWMLKILDRHHVTKVVYCCAAWSIRQHCNTRIDYRVIIKISYMGCDLYFRNCSDKTFQRSFTKGFFCNAIGDK